MAASTLVGLPEALRDYGLPVTLVDGWRTRGSGAFGRYEGVLLHHTAERWRVGSDAGLHSVVHGSRSAPPPVAAGYVGRSRVAGHRLNRVYMVSAEVANHAGTRKDPLSGRVVPGEVGGNSELVGWEVAHDGLDEPVTDEMIETVAAVAAATHDYCGTDPRRTWGHREWRRKKIDPVYSMSMMRDLVVARRRAGPGTGTGTGTGITLLSHGSTTALEDDMPLTRADAELVADTIYNRQVRFPAIGRFAAGTAPTHQHLGWLVARGRFIADEVAAARVRDAANAATIAALAEALTRALSGVGNDNVDTASVIAEVGGKVDQAVADVRSDLDNERAAAEAFAPDPQP